MEWKEIVEKFKDEWILLDVKKVDENLNIEEDEVIAHSRDKDEIYKKLLELRPKSFSIEYTGKIPKNLAVVLYYENI